MGKDRFDIKEKEGISLMTDAVVIVDKETGVNYLSVATPPGWRRPSPLEASYRRPDIISSRMLMADYLFILIALMILPHWMPSRRAEKRSAEV